MPQPHEDGPVAEKPSRRPKWKAKCGAKNRPGAKHPTCQLPPVEGAKRCRRHGGLTPKGPDSPHWVHGRRQRGKKAPNLAEVYQVHKGDPELFQYRHDAALVEALRTSLLQTLKLDQPVPMADEKRLLDMSETLTRIKEREHRRLQILEQSIPSHMHRRAMQATSAIVHEVSLEWSQAAQAALAAGDLVKLKQLLDPMPWLAEMARRYRIAALRTPVLRLGGPDDQTPD